MCASSVLDDNWALHGPHHLLLPSCSTLFFQSKQEHSPWLEVSLKKESFLSGLLIICPGNNAPPLEASLLAGDCTGSGRRQFELKLSRDELYICLRLQRRKGYRKVNWGTKADDYLPRGDFLLSCQAHSPKDWRPRMPKDPPDCALLICPLSTNGYFKQHIRF